MPQCSLKTTVCTGSATRVSKQHLETTNVREDIYCCDACGENVFRGDVDSFRKQYVLVNAETPDVWIGLLDGVVVTTYASIRDAANAATTHKTMVLRYVPASRLTAAEDALRDAPKSGPGELTKDEALDDAHRYVNELSLKLETERVRTAALKESYLQVLKTVHALEAMGQHSGSTSYALGWREAARQASAAITASCPDLDAKDPDALTDRLKREGKAAAAAAATHLGDAVKRAMVAPWDKNELATHRRVVDRYPAITSLVPMPGDHVARWVATLDEAQARIDELTQSQAKAVDAITDVCAVLHCDHHFMVETATRLRDECALDNKQLSEAKREVEELEEIISDTAAAGGIMLGGDGDGGLVDAVDALRTQLTAANAKLKDQDESHHEWAAAVQKGYARGVHDAAQRVSAVSTWLPAGGQNERLRAGLAEHVRSLIADVCIMNDDVQQADARTDARKYAAATYGMACDSCGDDDPLTQRVRVGEQWLCHDCAPDEPVAPSPDPKPNAGRIHTYWHGTPCQCSWAADHGNGGPDGPDFAKGRDRLDDEQRPDILVTFSSFGPETCRALADATDMDRQYGVLYIPAYRFTQACTPAVRTQETP